MDSPILLILFSVFVVVITWLAGIPPFKHQRQRRTSVDYSTGEALACGIFLGAALLHMLPESSKSFHNLGLHFPFAFLGAGSIFLLLLWLEHLGTHISDHSKSSNPQYAWLSAAVLSIHSIFAGAALGSAPVLSTALIIMLAIVAHKWAASFALAVKLAQSGKTLKKNLIVFGIFSIAFPLGVAMGSISGVGFEGSDFLEPTFNAFAAGTFLYLGTLHGLTRATLIDRCCNRKDFNYVILGFILMAIVATAH